MDEWFELDVDPAHLARERAKARELRKTAWWQRRIGKGVCAYCGDRVQPRELTLDHIVPIARGGRSVKGNVAPSCRECNTKKKLLTPAEQILFAKRAQEDVEDG